MKKYFFTFLVLLTLVACDKDKFQTKPTLEIKATNTKLVQVGDALTVTLEYTDKEGDVSDSLMVIRQRLNKKGAVVLRPLPYKIPEFPETTKGEINVLLDYYGGLTLQLNSIRVPGSNPSRNEADTMNLKFVAKDKAGNFSDTVSLNDVIVIR